MSKVTVLIVDDNGPVRETIAGLLEENGFATLEAENGEVALRIIESERPEVVITDIVMPVMDGVSMISEMSENFPDTKLIAISGANPSNGIDFLDTAQKLGASRVLAKPFKPREIVDAVVSLFSLDAGLDEVEILRRERDHYLGFALCVGDAFFELGKTAQ